MTEIVTVYAYLLMMLGGLQNAAPVGGFLEPINKLAVLAPWLAMIGLFDGEAVVAVARKHRS